MGHYIQIREFNEEDISSVYDLIQNTIDFSYHCVYSKEAIDLFAVEAGNYEIICLPILLKDGDAGPARPIVRPL